MPRRVEGIDIAKLPLSPADAFVLSQLDGATALEEIALVTGMDLESTRDTVHRLALLGAVRSGANHRPVDGRRQSGRVRVSDPRVDDDEPTEIREEYFGSSQRLDRMEPVLPPPVISGMRPTRIEETVDLAPAQRTRIDEMFGRLDACNHYQLLGIERDAAKKTIKNAYFELIPLFHPDKFFGRSLGSYKKKLEKIFERLAEAESVLTRKGSRREYDDYLDARRQTRAFNAVLTSIPPPPESSRPQPSEADSCREQAPTPSLDPVAAAEQRSRALARRLAGARRIAPEISRPPAASSSPEELKERAGESLRRFLAGRRSPQVEKFVTAGSEALANESWISAVNALRIASNLAPDDDDIRALYEQADSQATRHLADSYEASAKYEEKNAQWDRAAGSWTRVAARRPEDPNPWQRAAECYLHTEDPRQGLRPAREAVLLAPDVVDYRLTLARVYEAAGLVTSAIGELKRALERSPDAPGLREWLGRLQKLQR